MAEKPIYGGHECEFVQEVFDRLNCQICTKVLRDPHLAVCCGQHFCKSCLNKWFARQGKESCPHCRAEGEAFHHVINKGLRSEINQLKIRCNNHRDGCQWTGEMGALKKHLESDNGCGFVTVECPNKCINDFGDMMVMKRKDAHKHLTQSCYLRPHLCSYCGLKDTYEAITGMRCDKYYIIGEDDYFGHEAECPEAPLTCLNKCGCKMTVKRKDMESHRSQCPQEPVRCPFAEAGCNVVVRRHQLEDHMTSNLQLHLLMMMKDQKKTKAELHDMKLQLNKVESKLSIAEDRIAWLSKLQIQGDSVRFEMPKFSEYRRSGKVWHSPPFYYGQGYKMCLAVYANGVGKGAGTHVSVSLLLIRGAHDNQLKWPMKGSYTYDVPQINEDGYCIFNVHISSQCPADKEYKPIGHQDKFCRKGRALYFVNDCLTLNVELNDGFLTLRI